VGKEKRLRGAVSRGGTDGTAVWTYRRGGAVAGRAVAGSWWPRPLGQLLDRQLWVGAGRDEKWAEVVQRKMGKEKRKEREDGCCAWREITAQ
jgi:hypothetical protein